MQVRTERDLGLVIRERRKELGLDQATLAARVRVSRQWVVEMEKGKPRAEVGLILRTLRVLDIELNASVVGSPPSNAGSPVGLVDIHAMVDRARGDQGKE